MAASNAAIYGFTFSWQASTAKSAHVRYTGFYSADFFETDDDHGEVFGGDDVLREVVHDHESESMAHRDHDYLYLDGCGRPSGGCQCLAPLNGIAPLAAFRSHTTSSASCNRAGCLWSRSAARAIEIATVQCLDVEESQGCSVQPNRPDCELPLLEQMDLVLPYVVLVEPVATLAEIASEIFNDSQRRLGKYVLIVVSEKLRRWSSSSIR